MGFGQTLILMIFVVGLFAGFIYWIRFFIKKTNPDFKYDLRYKIFKKKYNEKDVERLLDYHQAGMSVDEVHAFLLTKGNINPEKAKELCYIYKQIQLKGGIKNGK